MGGRGEGQLGHGRELGCREVILINTDMYLQILKTVVKLLENVLIYLRLRVLVVV